MARASCGQAEGGIPEACDSWSGTAAPRRFLRDTDVAW